MLLTCPVVFVYNNNTFALCNPYETTAIRRSRQETLGREAGSSAASPARHALLKVAGELAG